MYSRVGRRRPRARIHAPFSNSICDIGTFVSLLRVVFSMLCTSLLTAIHPLKGPIDRRRNGSFLLSIQAKIRAQIRNVSTLPQSVPLSDLVTGVTAELIGLYNGPNPRPPSVPHPLSRSTSSLDKGLGLIPSFIRSREDIAWLCIRGIRGGRHLH